MSKNQDIQRIFWLGMHRVLKKTELVHLRKIGYEVFNPAYISPVFDQSADLTIDVDQDTTLPKEVFDTLIDHDFFYTSVPPHIAELLNLYFDAVIVTIHADWFKSIAEVFDGPIIYRIYGQPWLLSDHLISNGGRATIAGRDNIHVMPFAAESVEKEHQWFLDLCTAEVPYQIPNDVFAYTGTWRAAGRRQEITVSIPNIEDPYYSRIYSLFGAFPQPFFRILGPQRSIPHDPRIIGGLPRDRFLSRLAESAGYFYPYQDNVCYLPPIEAMQVGAPVIYMPGSLLARFGEPDSPALASDPNDAVSKLRLFLDADKGFIAEVIDAQEPIRQRYDRALVLPRFAEAVVDALGTPDRTTAAAVRRGAARTATTKQRDATPAIAIPLHLDGLFVYVDGKPSAFEGIPRVIDVLIDFIVAETESNVVVTCNPASEGVVSDFFRSHIEDGRLSVYVLKFGTNAADAERNLARLEYITYLNNENSQIQCILIPHYYLFPEAILASIPIILYLPDYFPHIMPDEVFDVSAEKDLANKDIGTALGRKAQRILTNSYYTKGYIPVAGFVEPSETDKIVVAPLPLLGRKRAIPLTRWAAHQLRERIGNRPFLFYPTANRPNKKLAFLMRVFAHLRLSHNDLCLVLTCDLGSVPAVREAADGFGLHGHIARIPGASDSELRWLYENAVALCLTSVAEGNFPPQMLEALAYQTPIVATRLPTVVETIDVDGDLLLCEPLNLVDFVDGIETVMSTRNRVLERQAQFSHRLAAWNGAEAFRARLPDIFPGLRLRIKSDSCSLTSQPSQPIGERR